MPIACGVIRPTVVLPAAADDWPDDRVRVVLLHELAHVRRRDCLTQAVADAACAVFWFNPLAWMAVRELRRERERACDDMVLAAGTPGPGLRGTPAGDCAGDAWGIARLGVLERRGHGPPLRAGGTTHGDSR